MLFRGSRALSLLVAIAVVLLYPASSAFATTFTVNLDKSFGDAAIGEGTCATGAPDPAGCTLHTTSNGTLNWGNGVITNLTFTVPIADDTTSEGGIAECGSTRSGTLFGRRNEWWRK